MAKSPCPVSHYVTLAQAYIEAFKSTQAIWVVCLRHDDEEAVRLSDMLWLMGIQQFIVTGQKRKRFRLRDKRDSAHHMRLHLAACAFDKLTRPNLAVA